MKEKRSICKREVTKMVSWMCRMRKSKHGFLMSAASVCKAGALLWIQFVSLWGDTLKDRNILQYSSMRPGPVSSISFFVFFELFSFAFMKNFYQTNNDYTHFFLQVSLHKKNGKLKFHMSFIYFNYHHFFFLLSFFSDPYKIHKTH